MHFKTTRCCLFTAANLTVFYSEWEEICGLFIVSNRIWGLLLPNVIWTTENKAKNMVEGLHCVIRRAFPRPLSFESSVTDMVNKWYQENPARSLSSVLREENTSSPLVFWSDWHRRDLLSGDYWKLKNVIKVHLKISNLTLALMLIIILNVTSIVF